MSRCVLGIDLGEASVGAAIAVIGDDEELLRVDHFHSRVFSPVTDPKSKTPLNLARRAARGARKNRERRTRRKHVLQNVLVRAGLLPSDLALLHIVLGSAGDADEKQRYEPYSLRKKALEERLDPYELGRALAHLGQRRGFRSNRKARLAEVLKEDPELFMKDTDADESEGATKEEKDEASETLRMIHDLGERVKASGEKTLGAYLASQLSAGHKVRGLRTSRQMFIDELEAIWASQSRWHASLLTPKLKEAVAETFEQRPLKAPRVLKPRRQWPDDNESARELQAVVSRCRMFPNKSVARADHFASHRFRIIQTLRNLRLRTDRAEDQALNDTQVRGLCVRLQREESITWAKVREFMGAPRGAKLNIEADDKTKKGLPGNRTERFFRQTLGTKWNDSLELDKTTEAWQLEFMQDIETAPDAKALFDLLQKPKANGNPLYPLTKKQAFEIAAHGWSRRTLSWSVRAMRKLHGEMLNGAVSTYHAHENVKQEDSAKQTILERLPQPPQLPNPRVMRALHELRRVVNALIDSGQVPDEIRIELARDIKATEKERKRTNKAQAERQGRNKEAELFFRDHGMTEPSRDDIARYRLWKECDERCPYTGRSISAADLLSERVEIEHILPLQRSGDDSFGNLTLTFREVNGEKGNRTPHEWLGGAGEKWEDARKRFVAMRNGGKLRRFLTQELDEDFTQRQLTDTRYACKAAREYLQVLGIPVWVSNGQATGLLRYQWGLNDVVPKREVKNPEKLKDGKQRLDHRHHAVDALVVALTTPKRYRQALLLKRRMAKDAPPPAQGFRALVARCVDDALTSHALDKGVRGALHDEMFYGRHEQEGEVRFVRRVSIREFAVDDFAKAMDKLERVYDDDLRERLMAHLRAFGKPKEAFGQDSIVLRDGAGNEMRIETVRVKHRLTDAGAVSLGHGRYVTTQNNHHAEIVRNTKGSLGCRAVSMLDVARAIHSERCSPYGLTGEDGETVVMNLCENEVVEYDGEPMRVAAFSRNDLRLRDLNDARAVNEPGGARLRSSTDYGKLGRKLRMDAVGRLEPVDGR